MVIFIDMYKIGYTNHDMKLRMKIMFVLISELLARMCFLSYFWRLTQPIGFWIVFILESLAAGLLEWKLLSTFYSDKKDHNKFFSKIIQSYEPSGKAI